MEKASQKRDVEKIEDFPSDMQVAAHHSRDDDGESGGKLLLSDKCNEIGHLSSRCSYEVFE